MRQQNGLPSAGRRRVSVLGSPVDCLTMVETVQLVRQAWQKKQLLHVVTANAEMVHAGTRNRQLGEAIRSADLVTADGAGVVAASRLLGCPAPERVAGYDLMLECLQEAAREGVTVYFLGADPEVLERSLHRAVESYPGLRVVGSSHGYFGEQEEKRILGEIRGCRPGLLLVAMGVPRQEKWIYKHKEKLPPCVVIGVGGSFDVLAGKTSRAPFWMQRVGLEWFYRILKEPRRLLRARALPAFMLGVLLQAAGYRRFPAG